jgi:exonuclease SbcD
MRILATADTHVGFRQYGLVRREQDIERSFMNVLKKGVELEVDAITISGDIIHSVRPTASTINFLKECQNYLLSEKQLCLVSIGNHDYSEPHWVSNLSTDSDYGFHVLHDGRHQFTEPGSIVGDLYAKSFCSKSEFAKGSCIPPVDILLMHQSFNELTNFPNEHGFSFDDFEELNAKVVVIGDTHIHRVFEKPGMKVCSPGSTEMMSESEDSDKYVFLIEKEGEEFKVESLPISTRKVIRRDLDSEDQMQELLGFLKQEEINEPIVFLRFNTEIKDVLSRIRKQIDTTKVIVRPKPINVGDKKENDKAIEQELTFSDMLKEFIPDNPKQFETVSQLLNPQAEVHSVLDSFIEERLKESND